VCEFACLFVFDSVFVSECYCDIVFVCVCVFEFSWEYKNA